MRQKNLRTLGDLIFLREQEDGHGYSENFVNLSLSDFLDAINKNRLFCTIFPAFEQADFTEPAYTLNYCKILEVELSTGVVASELQTDNNSSSGRYRQLVLFARFSKFLYLTLRHSMCFCDRYIQNCQKYDHF